MHPYTRFKFEEKYTNTHVCMYTTELARTNDSGYSIYSSAVLLCTKVIDSLAVLLCNM